MFLLEGLCLDEATGRRRRDQRDVSGPMRSEVRGRVIGIQHRSGRKANSYLLKDGDWSVSMWLMRRG